MKNFFPQTGLRVLIADDDADDRDMFCEVIEVIKSGAILNTVWNGEELMEYLALSGENTPRILFLDLNLPRKNGMECLSEIRNNAAFANMMIVIYSTSKEQKYIDDAFSAGANLYVTKPATFTAIEKVVAHVLSIDWQLHTANFSKESFVMAG